MINLNITPEELEIILKALDSHCEENLSLSRKNLILANKDEYKEEEKKFFKKSAERNEEDYETSKSLKEKILNQLI